MSPLELPCSWWWCRPSSPLSPGVLAGWAGRRVGRAGGRSGGGRAVPVQARSRPSSAMRPARLPADRRDRPDPLAGAGGGACSGCASRSIRARPGRGGRIACCSRSSTVGVIRGPVLERATGPRGGPGSAGGLVLAVLVAWRKPGGPGRRAIDGRAGAGAAGRGRGHSRCACAFGEHRAGPDRPGPGRGRRGGVGIVVVAARSSLSRGGVPVLVVPCRTPDRGARLSGAAAASAYLLAAAPLAAWLGLVGPARRLASWQSALLAVATLVPAACLGWRSRHRRGMNRAGPARPPGNGRGPYEPNSGGSERRDESHHVRRGDAPAGAPRAICGSTRPTCWR